MHQFAQQVHVFGLVAEIVVRETRGEQAFLQLFARRYLDPLAVQESSTTFPSGESFVARDLMHHAKDRLRAIHQGDADAVAGDAMDEVGGPIQGVDDPVEPFAAFAAAFLGDEPRLRQDLLQGLHQPVLGGVVHVGHQVVRALFGDARCGELARLAADESGHIHTDGFDLFGEFLEFHRCVVVSCRLSWLEGWRCAFSATRSLRSPRGSGPGRSLPPVSSYRRRPRSRGSSR